MISNHSNWYLDVYTHANSFLMSTSSPTLVQTYLPTLPNLTLINSFVSLGGDSLAIFPYYLWGIGLGATLIYWFILNSSYNVFLTSLFSFSEKEINALDDLLVGVFLIFLFFFFNFLGCFAFIFSCSYSLGFSMLFLGLCFMLVSIPTTMVYNFGFYFIISIRGGATTLSYIYELILDYVNLISFALRLCIQLVRVVVIGVTYYMYNHLFFVYNYLVSPSTSSVFNGLFTLTSYLIMWARLIFEVGHTFVIFGIQLIAFNVMVLWLFQFLFTLFFAETLEHSFLKRTL